MAKRRPNAMDWAQVQNPESGRHYVWLNSMDKTMMARSLMPRGGSRGYRLEGGKTREEAVAKAEELGFNEFFVDSNNRIAYAELVLASCAMEDREAEFAAQIAEAKRASDVADDAYMANLDAIRGVTPVVQNAAEFQEQKEHSERPDTPVVGHAQKAGAPVTKADGGKLK